MVETIATPKTNLQMKTFGRGRLSPGIYSLDLSVVQGVSLKSNGQESTFVDIYSKLRDSKVKEMPEFMRDRYVTDSGEITLDGNWPLLSTMRKLIELTRQGIDPHRVMWFYYDHDWSRDGDESYIFFVVHDGNVFLESCHFSSEEPMVLKREPDKEPIWHSHPYFDEAVERYWYRRFYSETTTGQLMVLRPDEPILYHYERPQTRDLAREIELVTLVKLYRLLWVAVPLLVALVFPSLRYYMALAALVLGIDVLWRCWAARKVGQNQ